MGPAGPFHDARGSGFTEYIVTAGLVALACLAAHRLFGSAVAEKAQNRAACVADLSACQAPAAGTGPMLPTRSERIAEAAKAMSAPAPPSSDESIQPEPVGAVPPPGTSVPAGPPDAVVRNADRDFAEFAGTGDPKKGRDFWVAHQGGRPVAFGFKAGAAIDSDAATNVARTRSASKGYTDPHYRSGTTVKFSRDVPVLSRGKPVLENGKPIERTVTSEIPSNEIPYVALPPGIRMARDKMGRFVPGEGALGTAPVRPGDYVRVTYRGKSVYAIFADSGPSSEVGEISMYLAKALGMSDNPRHGGVDEQQVEYEVLPGSGRAVPVEGIPGAFEQVVPVMSAEQIQSDAKAAFDRAADRGWLSRR